MQQQQPIQAQIGNNVYVVGTTSGTTVVVGGPQTGVSTYGTSEVPPTDKRWRQQTTVAVESRTGCCGLLTACTLISLCNNIVAFMISGKSELFSWFFDQIGITNEVNRDWGEQENYIRQAFTCIRILSVVLAAVVLVKCEYRYVTMVAAVVMSLSVLIASFVSNSLTGLIGFLVGGIAGVASGFLYMCAILPVLEHFEDGLFRALHAVHQAETIGYVVCSLISLATGNAWRALFRWQVLVLSVAFGASFALSPAEFHDSSIIIRGTDGERKTKRKLAWSIFKHPSLYLLMVGYFLQRLGFRYLEGQAQALGTVGVTYFILFYVAQWLGPILLFFKQCVQNYYPQVILVAISTVAGVYAIAIPQVDNTDSLLIVFIIIVGIVVSTTESFRDVMMTKQFLKEQYCLTYGVLYTCAGLGEIVATVTEKSDDSFINPDSSEIPINVPGSSGESRLDVVTLNVSGSVLIVSAVVIGAAAIVYKKVGFPLGECPMSCFDFRRKFTRLNDMDAEHEEPNFEGNIQEEVSPYDDPNGSGQNDTDNII